MTVDRDHIVPAPIAALLLCVLLAQTPALADWPQWRGPAGDGSSPATGLPVRWSATDNVAWKLPLPARSGSTPIVSGDRIFLSVSHDPERDDRLELWSIDRGTGEVVWKRPLGGGNVLSYKQHMSSPSPVTDGTGVWAMTGTGVLKAFDRGGKELWSRDLQAEYGRFGLQWGYASSPLLLGDSLYVQVLHGMKTDDPSYLLRIDKKTGETRWRVERPTDARRESPDAYTTPAVAETRNGREIVVSGGDVVTGHDPATGRELWRADGLNPSDDTSGRIVASPVVVHDLVIAFGKRGPILAVRAGGRGDVTRSALAWSRDKGTDVPTPASDGRHLYVVNDGGIAWCLVAATGEVVWGPERLAGGTYSASPVVADGKVFAVNESGLTTVFKTGPQFEVLAENPLDGYTLSTPAVSEGQIFLRTDQALYAIGERRGR